MMCSIFCYVLQRSVYVDLLSENSPFADAASIDRHLSQMQRLNRLQSKIMGVRVSV